MQLIEGLHELVFPSRCLGCRTPNRELCSDCAKDLRPRDLITHLGSVPVFSSIPYGPKASHILLAAKEDGVKRADEILLNALQHSLRLAIRTCRVRPVLVPIPHSKKALRMRGRNFVGDMADCLSQTESLPVRQLIRHNRSVHDQSLLDASQRFGNLFGAMNVVGNCGRASAVFLVDDLMTTGATLGEAVRTLEIAEFHVVAAVTACVALPLR